MSNPAFSPEDEFHMWIGKCITAWAKVEEHLFDICVKSLGTTQQKAAIVYFRTPTLDTRLKLVDELVRTVLPKRERKDGGHDHEDVKTWNKFRKQIGEILPVRNRLAHHPVFQKAIGPLPPPIYSSAAATDLFTFSWFESYMSEPEQLRESDKELKPLMTGDLSSHRIETELVITNLEIFRRHVLSKYVQ